MKEHVTDSGAAGIVFTEGWWAGLDQYVPRIIEVALKQRDAYRAEGISLMPK